MHRREFLKLTSIAAAGAVLPGMAGAARPNFVFLLVDDLGWSDLACYGSEFYETPRIDELADSGVLFTDAYAASPVCSPTRAAIMSGKYPARLDTTDWFGSRRSGKVGSAPYVDRLPLGEVTLAEALRGAGYRTFFTGKWHLGREDFCPESQGFEINKGGYHAGRPHAGYFSPYQNPKLEDGPRGEYLTDRLTQETTAFLDSVGRDPFLAFLSYYAVHTPIMAKNDMRKKYRKKRNRGSYDFPYEIKNRDLMRSSQTHPSYAGMVETVDDSVGAVMDKLQALGLAENTYIILASDNGGLASAEQMPTCNAPLRKGKGWLYEGGIRTPLIIKGPGIAPCRSSEPVISMDYYPTVLDLAGLARRPEQHMDGMSLAGLLTRETGSLNRALFWHYPHYWHRRVGPASALRDGNLKLIHFYQGNRTELYDLANDISETHDLSCQRPHITQQMKDQLEGWIQEVDGKLPPRLPTVR